MNPAPARFWRHTYTRILIRMSYNKFLASSGDSAFECKSMVKMLGPQKLEALGKSLKTSSVPEAYTDGIDVAMNVVSHTLGKSSKRIIAETKNACISHTRKEDMRERLREKLAARVLEKDCPELCDVIDVRSIVKALKPK